MARRQAPVICIVDDEESLRVALARLFGAAGYEVQTFPSPQALLRFERLTDARCFLLDVDLRGDDGIALRERLLASGVRAPVVFMSGSHDAATRERALRAGATDYLKKPFEAAAILAAVGKVFGGG